MKICFIGTGYVGLVSGVLFSDFGNTVYCVDNNKKKIKDLENNILPIYEPGLDEIVNKNFNEDGERISADKEDRNKEFVKFSEELEWYANALKVARNLA